MSMVSELVKELRKYAEEYKNLPWSEVCEKTKRMLNCAADTIEELSAKVARQNMERSSQYYGGGWIPCSERLPDDSLNFVLVTVKAIVNGGTHDGEYIKIVGIACYSDFYCKWDLYSGYSIKDYGAEVLAWQPLPPAYEPKGE